MWQSSLTHLFAKSHVWYFCPIEKKAYVHNSILVTITCCGSSFLEALCTPRDAALGGVRVEKKQVNSVSRLLCERVGS